MPASRLVTLALLALTGCSRKPSTGTRQLKMSGQDVLCRYAGLWDMIFTIPKKLHNLQKILSAPYPASPTNSGLLELGTLFQRTLLKNQEEILGAMSVA